MRPRPATMASTLLTAVFGGACATSAPPHTATEPQLRVAITVDDLPSHGPDFQGVDRAGIAQQMLEAFKEHGLPPVYGFVNGGKVDARPELRRVLEAWVQAGQPLGNHTYGHLSLNKADLPTYLADLDRGEEILRSLEPLPLPWKLFRYPYLFEGDTLEKHQAVRAHLKAQGYQVAEVTIDADDWAFNPPYARCLERGDEAELRRLRTWFVEEHLRELRAMDALLHRLEGRPVPQILLLHVGVADAAALDLLIRSYQAAGVAFISLEEALADPFYQLDPELPAPYGAAFPYLVAKRRGVPVPKPAFARDLEAELAAVCR